MNPYREWLECDSDAPGPHELLGLPNDVKDPKIIRRATSAKLAKIRSIRPGEHAKIWQRLIDEINAAQDELLGKPVAGQRSSGPPAVAPPTKQQTQKPAVPPASAPTLKPKTAPSPAPMAAAAADPMAPLAKSPSPTTKPASPATTSVGPAHLAAQGSPDPMSPVAAQPMTPAHQATPHAPGANMSPPSMSQSNMSQSNAEGSTSYALIARQRARRQRFMALGTVGLSIVFVAVLGVLIYTNREAIFGEQEVASGEGPTQPGSEIPPAPSSGEDEEGTANTTDRNANGENENPGAGTDGQNGESGADDNGPDNVDNEPEDSATDPDDPTDMNSNPNMPTDPPNEPETPTRELTRPEAYALGQKLLDAHHALADRDFEQAEDFWSEARTMAADSDQEVLVDRLQIVGQTTRRCWDAIAQATSQLESTEELQFSPTVVVVVVEASEEKLIYRVNGERQERAPRDLPPGLGKLILESVMDPGVELSTLLGALYAAEAANDPTKRDNAETYWREADASGGDMRDLLGWLTDDYDLVGQNFPPADVPSKDEIETAKEQVTDAISQVTSDARTPLQRIEAGNELIDLAVKLDATPEAYVHFSEATSLIAGSGLISELKIPLEKWANWFEIDDLATRTALLERCSRVGAPTEECQETVRQSLELAQRALGKKEFDLVDRLLDAANGAAQKSKDQQTRSETLLKVRQLKQRLAQAKADA